MSRFPSGENATGSPPGKVSRSSPAGTPQTLRPWALAAASHLLSGEKTGGDSPAAGRTARGRLAGGPHNSQRAAAQARTAASPTPSLLLPGRGMDLFHWAEGPVQPDYHAGPGTDARGRACPGTSGVNSVGQAREHPTASRRVAMTARPTGRPHSPTTFRPLGT